MIIENRKKILFACMDWGLGHATRSVQLIKELNAKGHEIILASAGQAFYFLQNYFPNLKIIQKPAYDIHYSKSISVTLSLLFQLPSFLKTIKKENEWLKKVQIEYGIDEVYSDNCYGLYNQKIPSTIITHQLMVKCPTGLKFLESTLHKKILSYTDKFDQCWIPDYEGVENLSGDLSHKYPLPKNASFIGPLSRFENSTSEENKYDYCALISGPEPLRTQLEEHCIHLFKKSGKQCVIIRGLPDKKDTLKVSGIEIHNHLNDDELKRKILQSDKIICRSGYSTIMDLHALQKDAIFIPTPGQTEQIYLAERLLKIKSEE